MGNLIIATNTLTFALLGARTKMTLGCEKVSLADLAVVIFGRVILFRCFFWLPPCDVIGADGKLKFA